MSEIHFEPGQSANPRWDFTHPNIDLLKQATRYSTMIEKLRPKKSRKKTPPNIKELPYSYCIKAFLASFFPQKHHIPSHNSISLEPRYRVSQKQHKYFQASIITTMILIKLDQRICSPGGCCCAVVHAIALASGCCWFKQKLHFVPSWFHSRFQCHAPKHWWPGSLRAKWQYWASRRSEWPHGKLTLS